MYTAAQYAAQERVMRIARAANAAGVCPICGQPQATWPDGVRRITCASQHCQERWLAIRPRQRPPAPQAPQTDSLASDDGFSVSIVIGERHASR